MRLESTVVEMIFPKKKNICGAIYKHPGMKLSDFNNEYLTPLFAKILQEEKTCPLIGDFNINLLNTNTDLVEYFCSLHFTANKVGKKSYHKTLINSINVYERNYCFSIMMNLKMT